MPTESISSTQPGQRIVVVGSTGSGKSTLARQLAKRLALSCVELDALYWESGWTPAPLEVFRERVNAALSGDRWVVDGNYHLVRDLVWLRADTLIWLDYSLSLVLWRLWWRTLWRITRQPELWNGNRETWRGTFFSRDSLFIWVFKSYNKRRKEYPEVLATPAYTHLAVGRFRSPRNTQQWLSALQAQEEYQQAHTEIPDPGNSTQVG
jgi:adenylate kinase family enzyme